MAIRNSQDVTLVPASNAGHPRVSQDVTLVPASNAGAPRLSQDVTLVLARPYRNGPIVNSQAAQSLDVTAHASGTIVATTQASQSLALSGTVAVAIRDSQDLTVALASNVGNPRLSQDITLVPARNAGAPRLSQDIILVLCIPGHNVTTDQAQQSLDMTGTVTRPTKPDKPSRQLHPVVKPLDFSSRPLTQAGRRSATFTTLLTEAGASRAFSMPLGARNQPIAGKVFSFTMGGTMTPGTASGTLSIVPLYGANSDGVNLGQSLPQPYSGSTTPIQWRLKAEIVFQSVDLTSGASLVICTGSFVINGSSALFGSVNPIQVDASSIAANASGAVNFAAAFAPSTLNSQQPVITTKYAFLR
jgi:hypothetical protein